MKKYLRLFILFAFIIVVYSCTSDSTEDLDPTITPNESVTYTNDVKNIIDNNCLACHINPPTNGAPIPLVTYTQVKNATENGALINRIERIQGTPGVMPPGGSTLSTGQVQAINDWKEQGYIE